jgi:hypothetical protein
VAEKFRGRLSVISMTARLIDTGGTGTFSEERDWMGKV